MKKYSQEKNQGAVQKSEKNKFSKGKNQTTLY